MTYNVLLASIIAGQIDRFWWALNVEIWAYHWYDKLGDIFDDVFFENRFI